MYKENLCESVVSPKKFFFFGSGFRPTLSIYVRPKLFYELGGGKKSKEKKPHSADMLGGSIAAVKQKSDLSLAATGKIKS